MCHRTARSVWVLIGAWALLAYVPAPAAAHPPSGIVVDAEGTVFYLPSVDGRIRRLAPDGTSDTFLPRGDDGEEPDDPHKLAIDRAGNLYLRGSYGVWRISPGREVSVFLPLPGNRAVKALPPDGGPEDGGGETEDAYIFWNTPLAVDSEQNLYCVNYSYEQELCRVLRVNPDGEVRIIAGGKWGHRDGKGADARFHHMGDAGMAVGPDDVLYLTDGEDGGGACVRRVTPDGEVTTLAGAAGEAGFADGEGAEARFRYAVGLAVDADGNVYVADSGNRRIRKVTPQGVVTTVAGTGEKGHDDGPALEATFTRPTGVALGPKGELYIFDQRNALAGSKQLRKLADGRVTTLE